MSLFRTTVTAAGLLIAFIDGLSAMTVSEKAAVQGARITLSEAISIAQRAVPGGLIVDADAATVGGKVSYSIEILKDRLYDVRIDLDDGTVLMLLKKRPHPREWKKLAAVEEAAVSLQDAIGLAEENLPGGNLISADVANRRDKPTWDINLEKDGNLHTMRIDAASGDVIRLARLPEAPAR